MKGTKGVNGELTQERRLARFHARFERCLDGTGHIDTTATTEHVGVRVLREV